MAFERDAASSPWSTDSSTGSTGPAPGKTALTQRMVRAAAPPQPAPPAPAPAATAIQRAQLERDLAGAVGFFGGPAETVDASCARVQLQRTDGHTGLTDDAIAAHAARGVAGSGQALPHLDAIQRAFGPHDVTGVQAHVGGAAADASAAIGAHAYATGDHVAFGREPDLFLAAHEAAHVVQQRAGVHLASAVGAAGDVYERHADEVAAAVVRGESAAGLLAAGPGGGGGGAAVQRQEVSTWTPQDMGSVVLDGSAYLASTATGPTSYENKFSGKDQASVEIGHSFAGVLRIHLQGLAYDSWISQVRIPKSQLPKLDLLAVWNLDYDGETMTLDFDDSLLARTKYPTTVLGSIELVASHTENTKTFLHHPGSVTLEITPKTYGNLINADLEYEGIGMKLGNCELPPMKFTVPIYSLGIDPLIKAREEKKQPPAPPVVNNDNRQYNITTEAKTKRPPLPDDLAPGFDIYFAHEGDTEPTAEQSTRFDDYLKQVKAFNKQLAHDELGQIDDWYRIVVTGHASNTAADGVDDHVAEQRAIWMRDKAKLRLGLVGSTEAVLHGSDGHLEAADEEAAETAEAAASGATAGEAKAKDKGGKGKGKGSKRKSKPGDAADRYAHFELIAKKPD